MTNNLEEFIFRFRWQIVLLLVGLALAAGGVFLALQTKTPKFEIIEDQNIDSQGSVVVEVSGAVNSPGVYELSSQDRIDDAISAAGGLSPEADRTWVEKYLNKASYVVDGQKIYIPSQSEEASANNQEGDKSISSVLNSQIEGTINVNTASGTELEELKGIGPVYAQKIIDNRPYSSVEELLMKKVITQKIYDANRELLTVY